ncbi:MAG: CheR family methyltransferase, partial [Candidatus Caenarcaniphilales bacterium]|nr:CheR family methyltransferase [Candidatus Caenarcaniphilales bacterium]
MHNHQGKPSPRRKDRSQKQIASPKEVFAINEVDFGELKNFLLKNFSLKLDGYRDEYLLRRVSYHFRKSRAQSLNDYLERLTKEELLIHDLLDVLTVNVSYFFRDGESFDFLKKNILPELLHRFPYLRVWSMGCSIGAEIYSVALILHSMEALSRVDLLASDNDVGALKKAVKGEFHTKELRTLPDQFRSCFTKIEREGEPASFLIS